MSDAVRVLSQLAYLDIFKGGEKTAIDVKGWVANQKYLVDSGMTSTCFILSTHDSDGLRMALANDCNRMAMAAIESISGVKEDVTFPKSSSWATIRSYYSSFFAAHALLRIFGYSYSQLEIAYTNKILEVAKTLGVDGGINKIESGLYRIVIDKSFTTLRFEKQKDSHKDMWKGFLGLIDELDTNISKTTAITVQKTKAHDLLMEVKKCVTKNGSRPVGNWLSELRNQVNYQHSHGAWFPYEIEVMDRRVIQAVTTSWQNSSDTFDVLNKRKELNKFFESTALMLSFFREMLCFCSEKAQGKKSVFENGALRLLRTIKVI